MRNKLFFIGLTALIVCVALAPALIWSGQRSQMATEDRGIFKEPSFFTVGPPMTPEEIATRETEKRLSISQGQAWSNPFTDDIDSPWAQYTELPPETVPPPSADHPGLSQAEREKLAAIRSKSLKPSKDAGMWGPKPELQSLKLEAPPRPPGPEGLTPEEKAKLEASRTREEKSNRDGGRRSR